MKRLSVFAACCGAWLASWAAVAQAPSGAASVEQVLGRISQAMERKDTEAVMACYSDHYLAAAPPHTKGDLRRYLQGLLDADAEVSCSFEVLGKSEQGNRALVLARYELDVRQGGGDACRRSDDLKIKLIRAADGWRIVSVSRLIPETGPLKLGGLYVVDTHGVQVRLPERWHPYLTAPGPGTDGTPPMLELESPDLTSQISFTIRSLAIPIAPEAVADIFQSRINAFVPDCRIVECTVREGDRGSEIRLDVLMPGSELAELKRSVVLQRDNDLVIFGLNGLRRAEVDKYDPVFRAMIDSLKDVPRAPLPPSRGRLVGRTYTNDVYGCRIEFPAGWKASIGSALSFCALARSPDERALILVGGLQLPEAASAEKILDGDDAFASQLDPSFELLGKGRIVVGGREGAESYSVFEIGAPRRKRWRVYLVRDDVLYLVVSDATPPEAFDEHREALREAVNSLRLVSRAPIQEKAASPAP